MTQRYDEAGQPMTAAEAAAWDAEVDARFAAIRAEREAAEQPAEEQPPAGRSAGDIGRIARQIKGYERQTPEHIEDIAKRIRGPF
ncbi:hypothetical protein [Micromonospora yangpuensis]|uniref:Uncharacterized protein n=1 Tax=Micromonospora yangpuensis TaxID=683228 RepID=A0A1C6U723_9ACTN|nr:hypothetical protein [Micromonospora yangpuensis]GGL90384.1 hypothetical protein GCM10012279_05190 [Micromonospora yangpuensis]SCL49822.1 hypothetical protein GA0070617_1296 [Micromonospora yangpuensis]